MQAVQTNETQNHVTGGTISFIVHLALLLLMFMVPMAAEVKMDPPPPELGGVLVALGEPDKGQGNDPAPQGQQMEDPSQTEEVPDPKPNPPKPSPTKPSPPTPPAPTKPTTKPSTPSSSVTSEDAAAAVKRRQETEAKAKAKADADAKAQAAANAKAAADAKAKAAADAKAKADAAKGKYGSAFGKGKGTGQGNTGIPGNQGDPNGDPNSSNLEGVSGSGSIGGGLGGRKVKSKAPKIIESSNAIGKVVIEVCVDANGNVTSAKFKQGGSTTNNPDLVNAAIANAKKYTFEGTTVEKECGTISYNFQAQ